MTVQLTQLNRRINDGGQEEGSDSVYIWVIMFAFDGTGIHQSADYLSLTGSPQWFFSAGSDGNLNQDISQGQGIPVPASVGTWFLNLQPILLTDPRKNPPVTKAVPATIVVLAVLLKDNLTPTGDMEAGHQALNAYVQSQIENFVTNIDLQALSQTPASKTAQVIQNLLQPVSANIQENAPTVVTNAVTNALGLGGEIASAIDPDKQLGSQNLTIQQSQLTTLKPSGGSYTAYQFQLIYPMSNDTYYLYGFAQNLNQVVIIPPGVPPGRWQVTGVNKGFSNSLRTSYIKEIGGQLADGSQWYLERSAAVKLIHDGVNTFYVVGADGSQADVIASDKPIEGDTDLGAYLTPTPDWSEEDNLDSLPPFSTTKLLVGPPSP